MASTINGSAPGSCGIMIGMKPAPTDVQHPRLAAPEGEHHIGQVVARAHAHVPPVAGRLGLDRRRRTAGHRRRIAGGARGEADHAQIVVIGDHQPATGIFMVVAVDADRVLVDERRLGQIIVQRIDVGGGHAGLVPDLTDQAGALIDLGDQVQEPAFLQLAQFRPRHGFDLGLEIGEIVGWRGHGQARRKIGRTQPSRIGFQSTVTFMPMLTSSAGMPTRLLTSRAPGAPSRSTTIGT